MKLTFEQIEAIATGAVRTEKEDGKLRLCRFTQEQEELYKSTDPIRNKAFYDKALASSGIRLCFKTDSESLTLKFDVKRATSREYFSCDVFADGKPMGFIDNYSNVTLPVNYTTVSLPLGSFEKKITLGKGDKEVCVYLPYSTKTLIEEVSVDDGAYIEAVKPLKKLLAFGDSITQGYDALRPSNRYSSLLADSLDAEEINKGIGGEIFFPALAKTKDGFQPDYVTVAYGTNDWSTTSGKSFFEDCKAFYTSLSESYPNSTIFAITPIWRKNYTDEKPFGPFEKVEEEIRKAVSGLTNVRVIRGFDFLPKDESYFADLRLHPNDSGFKHYAESLYKSIKEMI